MIDKEIMELMGTAAVSEFPYVHALENDKAFSKASELGLQVIFPDDHTVTVDVDGTEMPPRFNEILDVLIEYFPLAEPMFVTTSKSGNRHIYLRFQIEFTETEKIAIQAALGSDAKREILGLVRAKAQTVGKFAGYPTLMFETAGVQVPKSMQAGAILGDQKILLGIGDVDTVFEKIPDEVAF